MIQDTHFTAVELNSWHIYSFLAEIKVKTSVPNQCGQAPDKHRMNQMTWNVACVDLLGGTIRKQYLLELLKMT